MRKSIKAPIPEIFEAVRCLSDAVDAHLASNSGLAASLFKKADNIAVWEWMNPAWVQTRKNVVEWKPAGDTLPVASNQRDPARHPSPAVRAEVLARDGYRCRYCGIPVVPVSVRNLAHLLYSEAVPWKHNDPLNEHAAFQCVWLQFDHVVPHSHGGRSSVDNVVVTCGLCNYGKDGYTLRQLGISDPRLRDPVATEWDGLVRFLQVTPRKAGRTKVEDAAQDAPMALAAPRDGHCAYFLPDAWISAGYLYTKQIEGKERWFKLSGDVIAEVVCHDGISGCRLVCDPEELKRRGIDPKPFKHPEGVQSHSEKLG